MALDADDQATVESQQAIAELEARPLGKQMLGGAHVQVGIGKLQHGHIFKHLVLASHYQLAEHT